MRLSTRALFFGASGLAIALAIATACGFPDPLIVPDDQLVDTGVPADAADEPLPDGGELLIDGQSVDAFIVEDAGSKVEDAAGCDAICDCDGDGFLRPEHATACADSGKPATDCDDEDGRIHPNQGYLDIDPTGSSRNGDWNCMNGVEKLIPENHKCGDINLGTCKGEGFTGTTPCGQTGNAIRCVPVLGLFCETQAIVAPRQACR